MSTTRIGIRTPADLYTGPEAGGLYLVYDDDLDQEFTLYECLDAVGALIGVSPGSGGATVWWRTDSLAEGMEWIDAHV